MFDRRTGLRIEGLVAMNSKSSRLHRLWFLVLVLTLILTGMHSLSLGELITLNVEPNTFSTPSSVSVFVDAGLLGDDEVQSSLSGEITLDLQPSVINPATAQIVDLVGIVDSAIDFRVGGGFLLPTVTATADAGTVKVKLQNPGAPSEIVNGSFTQQENELSFEGMVQTSVQPEPFDLAEESTTVNFEDVSIESSRSSMSLGAELFTRISIPIEVGIFQLDVSFDIDGSLLATGGIPAATYSLQVPPSNVIPFSNPNHWLRNGVPDTQSLPIATDKVEFTATGSQGRINLGNAQHEAQSISVSGLITIQDGTLAIPRVDIEPDAVLVLDTSASISSADPSGALLVTGGGALQLAGTSASEIQVQNATLSGGGSVADLIIENSGSLQLSDNDTLNVENSLIVDGAELRLRTSDETLVDHMLLSAESIELVSPKIFINGEEVPESISSEPTLLNESDGIFGLLDVTDKAIRWTTTRAMAGDTDGNGTIDFADFLTLSSAFGQQGDWRNGDFDGNNLVEFADFLALSSNFGTVASAVVATPEPQWSQFATYLLCLLTLSLRNRIR